MKSTKEGIEPVYGTVICPHNNACHDLLQYQSFIDNISVITNALSLCLGSSRYDVIHVKMF